MLCTALTRSTCLPVPALRVCQYEDRRLLLAGSGSLLQTYDLSTNELLRSIRVFDEQAIHDITIAPCSGQCNAPKLNIAVTGGDSVALLSVVGSSESHIEKRGVLHAQDRILSARHHGLGHDAGFFALLTASNALLMLCDSKCKDGESTIEHITQGPKSFLYSGDICSAEASKLILAGGSAFGEIIVWMSLLGDNDLSWTTVPMHRFDAHPGSIFGIRISEPFAVNGTTVRLVASCSDDRQIQIRDISDVDDQAATHFASRTRDTGFRNHTNAADSRLIAMAWGHQSRIWDVEFALSRVQKDRTYVQVLSRGEDATCQSWQLGFSSDSRALALKGNLELDLADRHHAGKHVWSFAHQITNTGLEIISGGADGKLVRRLLPRPAEPSSDRAPNHFTFPFSDIPPAAKSDAVRDYMVVDPFNTLALTRSGKLLLCKHINSASPTWQLIDSPSDSKAVRLCSNCPPGIAIVLTETGLGFWSPAVGTRVLEAGYAVHEPVANLQLAGVTPPGFAGDHAFFLVLTLTRQTPVFFIKVETNNENLTILSTVTMDLGRKVLVTASYFHFEVSMLILGSRSGSLIFLDIQDRSTGAAEAITVVDGVHRADAVTSVQWISRFSISKGRCHILTTGRDGTYAIHAINLGDPTGVRFRTVHRSNPPFGPDIEGARLDNMMEGLSLFGFKSTNFVVWNETRQLTTASIDCGGAHRSWNYQDHGSGQGTFVWTKTRTFHLRQADTEKAEVIQSGGHGREIKALAVYRLLSRTAIKQHGALVATGAEDTEIRLFSVAGDTTSASTNFRCLAVLRDHTTGPQNLAFASEGQVLVSSGGCEQLYIWRLDHHVPVVEIGIVLQDKMPRVEEDADVRIMDFHLFNESMTAVIGKTGFSIAAAYSNGKVKLMRYTEAYEPGAGRFELTNQIKFGSFCLTQVRSYMGKFGQERGLLTAGTNGFISFCRPDCTDADMVDASKLPSQKVHQSSILTHQSFDLPGDITLIMTGGDDNALGLTIGKDVLRSNAQYRTLLVPKAHAAALSAMTVLSTWEDGGAFYTIFLTAGMDQRLKVWEARVSFGWTQLFVDEGMSTMKLKRLHEAWTAVADVSKVEVVGVVSSAGSHVCADIVVVGVGMEVVRVDIPLVKEGEQVAK